MNRGRGRPRNRGMLSLLALQVASQFYQLERKPPVTAGLIAANTLIYLRPGVLDDVLPPLSEVCLNPYLVLKDRDVKRLFLSAFYHVDESHLVYNMLSLLWKGVQLERMMGSTEFASMVALLLGLSHGIVVVLAKLLATFFDYPYALISECAVGFSAVLFALKVVLNSNSPNYANVYGVLVPARHAAWAELLLIQMFVPGVSFLGHLSGIFAGLLYLRLQRFFPGSNPLYPIIRKVTAIMGWPLRFLRGHLNRYSRRIFGHGTVGGRAVPHRTVGGRGARTAENGNAVWRCFLCAFDNSIHLEVCEMCGTRRGDNDLSPLAPPLLPTAPTVVSRDLSLEELRRLRLERFNRQ
uniref:Rhomboid protein Ginbi_RBL14 n=1 Tax=Ginkgo biloba TaxID=3311 RepID=A0A0A7E6Y5_GINBI|nr:rhomboid protein Ginbi_RBL14 [Ginkgo biloba]